jgi:hypothetical protein
MIERELIANWNSVMYPEPEPQASMPEPYGMEQMEQFQVAQAPTDQPLGFGGVSPSQFARGTLDTGAAVVKGAAQGFVGLPGDLEEIGRLLINLVGGDLDEEAYLATTDDIKKMLDQFAPLNARTSEREQKVSETVGELVAPGGYLKGVKEGVRGLKKGAEVLAPKAGEMAEDYLKRVGLMPGVVEEGRSIGAMKLTGELFKAQSDADRKAGMAIRLKNPVTLKDGSRLSGFTDPVNQTTFFGYDKKGMFTVSKDAVNPDDIVSSKDSDKTATAMRKFLLGDSKKVANDAGKGTMPQSQQEPQ